MFEKDIGVIGGDVTIPSAASSCGFNACSGTTTLIGPLDGMEKLLGRTVGGLGSGDAVPDILSGPLDESSNGAE